MTSDIATWVLVAAAAVQAISAAIIVWLTWNLAGTATAALDESKRQATIAGEALGESRRAIEEMGRQREVMERQRLEMRRQVVASALPILEVDRPWPSEQQRGELVTTVRVYNHSSTPVLNLRVQLYAQDSKHLYASTQRPMLRQNGGDVQLPIGSRDLYNMGLKEEDYTAAAALADVPAFYHSDRVIVVVSFDSPLGAHVIQRYRWYANHRPQGAEIVWHLFAMTVALGPDDPEPIELAWSG